MLELDCDAVVIEQFLTRNLEKWDLTVASTSTRPLNQHPQIRKNELFLRDVLRTYEVGDEVERRGSVVRAGPKSNGAYIEFTVGEHQTIPMQLRALPLV